MWRRFERLLVWVLQAYLALIAFAIVIAAGMFVYATAMHWAK